MTSQFGTTDSKFANIQFGVIDEVVPTTDASSVIFFTQEVQLNKILNLEADNTLSFSQHGNRAYTEDITNIITITQDIVYEKAKHLVANNTLTLTSDIAVEKIVNRSLVNTLVFQQQIARNIIKDENIVSNFNVIQIVTETLTKSTVNTLIFSQTADYVVSKIGKNTLALTQTVNVNLILQRTLHDVLEVFQTAQTGPNTLRPALSQSLSFTQQAVGHAVKGVNQSIVFTQNVIVNKVRGAINFALFSQSTIANINYLRSTNNQILLSHNVGLIKVKVLTAQNALSFAQVVKKQKLLFLTTQNTLNLTHELIGQRFIENVSQSLDLSQDVVVVKLVQPNINQSLNLNQTLNMTKTLNLSALNTLVFKNSFDKRVALGPNTTVNVPVAQVTRVKNLVILSAENRAITLPAPEFNDSEAGTGSLNIIRFKTGGRKVYVSDTGKQVLNYDFVLERNKVLELKSFIKTYNSKPIYLENWKGELWYVLFNSNPFSFSEDAFWEDENGTTGGNKFTVSLSFEGVRLN